MRVYLMFVNKKRERTEGAGETLPGAEQEKRELTQADYEDITDFNTVGFRYRM
jgi:hypothetical protein